MKMIEIIVNAEVRIFLHCNVSSDYKIKGATPYEIYQQLRNPDEPDLTVGDINLYDFGAMYGHFASFEKVTIDNTENPWGPVRVIPESFTVLNGLAELKKKLLNFFNKIDKVKFEDFYGVNFTEEQWDDFLNYVKETDISSIGIWINQYMENWCIYRGNLGKFNRAN